MGIGLWSMVVILYQTCFCCILSWLTLDCRLAPDVTELHEVTTLKLLYLYDPQACGRMYFYNFTARSYNTNMRFTTAVVWPVVNEVAASFRHKIRVWLFLHLLWCILGLANASQGNKLCAFYVTLIPFSLTGMIILCVDLVYAGLFMVDAKSTMTESAILRFINSKSGSTSSSVNATLNDVVIEEDTSWISVLLAYCSIRGVVQWVVNFWIVKDSFFDGLASYHRCQYQKPKSKFGPQNSQYSHNIEV